VSPTARSLAWLRREGWLPATVERWNPGARVRQDLFGFLDLLAMREGCGGLLGIQVTTTGHMADRRAKILGDPLRDRARVWLAAGNALEVWGWAKQGPRGKRKTWQLTRQPIALAETLSGPLPTREAR
jgi:hypothetical protein